MKVTIHKLFDYLLETTAETPPECFIGFSLARSPRLNDIVLGRFKSARNDDAFPMQPPRALWDIRQALGPQLGGQLVEREIEREIKVIPTGIDTDILQAAPDPISPWPAGKRRLLHVGRLGKEKSVDVVIRAFAEIRKELDAHLALIGAGPSSLTVANDLRSIQAGRHRIHMVRPGKPVESCGPDEPIAADADAIVDTVLTALRHNSAGVAEARA